MKKQLMISSIIATIFISTTVFGAGISTQAQVVFNNVDVLVDGKRVDADNIVYNGTTYIPLRKVSEATGLNVDYNSDTRVINLTSGAEISVSTKDKRSDSKTSNASFMINSVDVYVKGTKIDADNILYNGTTYLPLRSVGEALGNTVLYEETTKTVFLASSDEQAQKDIISAKQLGGESDKMTPPTGERPEREALTDEHPELPEGVEMPDGERPEKLDDILEGGKGLDPNSEEYQTWFNSLTEEEQAKVLEMEKNRPNPLTNGNTVTQ